MACEPARAHGYSSIVPYCAAGRRPLLMSSRPGLQPAAARGKCVIGLGVLREFRVGRWGFAMGFAYDRAVYFTDLLRDNTCRSSKRQDGNKRRDRGHRNRRTLLLFYELARLAPYTSSHMFGHHPATVRLAGRKRHARFENSEALAVRRTLPWRAARVLNQGIACRGAPPSTY